MIVANWKMNGSEDLLGALALAIQSAGAEIEVLLCPSYTLLNAAARYRNVWRLGAQNCHWAPAGSYTGGVSASMLARSGVTAVILGHSECRAAGDSDERIRIKMEAAWSEGLTPILCVGETFNELDAGIAAERVSSQLTCALPIPYAQELLIAYEPVWAIGSGRTPDENHVVRMRSVIQNWWKAQRTSEQRRMTKLLYGGSVGPQNIATALHHWAFDGVLIGTASLDPNSFRAMLENASRYNGLPTG